MYKYLPFCYAIKNYDCAFSLNLDKHTSKPYVQNVYLVSENAEKLMINNVEKKTLLLKLLYSKLSLTIFCCYLQLLQIDNLKI